MLLLAVRFVDRVHRLVNLTWLKDSISSYYFKTEPVTDVSSDWTRTYLYPRGPSWQVPPLRQGLVG